MLLFVLDSKKEIFYVRRNKNLFFASSTETVSTPSTFFSIGLPTCSGREVFSGLKNFPHQHN